MFGKPVEFLSGHVLLQERHTAGGKYAILPKFGIFDLYGSNAFVVGLLGERFPGMAVKVIVKKYFIGQFAYLGHTITLVAAVVFVVGDGYIENVVLFLQVT